MIIASDDPTSVIPPLVRGDLMRRCAGGVPRTSRGITRRRRCVNRLVYSWVSPYRHKRSVRSRRPCRTDLRRLHGFGHPIEYHDTLAATARLKRLLGLACAFR